MVRLIDIAKALDVSIGTVDRALHDRPGVNAATKRKVRQMAKSLGYRPNLAASVLSSRRRLRISVNLPQEIASFFDHVRVGIESEHKMLTTAAIDLEFRSFPRLGVGEVEAFDDAVESGVNGIITAVGHPGEFHARVRKALRQKVPTVCVVADATGSDRIAAVTIDTRASGGLVADLLGRFLHKPGEVAIFTGELTTADHVEKVEGFRAAMQRSYPHLEVLPPIETYDRAQEAYDKALATLQQHPRLIGCYVTTANSVPVLRALHLEKMTDRVTVLTTDLFPDLVPYLRSGAVAATIHQRPRAQGQLALRILQQYLQEGASVSERLTLAPHVVTRSNLDYFLTQHSLFEGRLEGRI
jgi:LacI family transcriptional regulator